MSEQNKNGVATIAVDTGIYNKSSFRVEKSRIPEEDLFDEGFENRVQLYFTLENLAESEEPEWNDDELCDDCLIIEHQDAFNRNLLKNAFGSGEDPQHVCSADCKVQTLRVDSKERLVQNCPKLRHWEIVDSGGCGWEVEPSPVGSGPLPGGSSCFVTSSGRCVKEQLVSLGDEGLSPELMDRVRPPLEFEEWCAARFDCGSIYKLKVSLLDKSQTPMREYSELRRLQAGEVQWQRVSFCIKDYPPGVHFLQFSHVGQATERWDGHCGSKMAGGSVVARLPCSFVCRKRRLTDCMTAAAASALHTEEK